MGTLGWANALLDTQPFGPGQRFLFSPNNRYCAALGDDGVLSVYEGTFSHRTISDPDGISSAKLVWRSSGPNPPPGRPPVGPNWYLQMNDGVLQIFSQDAMGHQAPVWTSGSPSGGRPFHDYTNSPYLLLQDDGLLCIYPAPPQPIDDVTSLQAQMGDDGSTWHSSIVTFRDKGVRGIRVHNVAGSTVVMRFCVKGLSNYGIGWSRYIAVGDSTTIDLLNTSGTVACSPAGASIYPKAQWGTDTHPIDDCDAGVNVVFDPNSNLYAVYDFKHAVFTRGFSDPTLSTDPS